VDVADENDRHVPFRPAAPDAIATVSSQTVNTSTSNAAGANADLASARACI